MSAFYLAKKQTSYYPEPPLSHFNQYMLMFFLSAATVPSCSGVTDTQIPLIYVKRVGRRWSV